MEATAKKHAGPYYLQNYWGDEVDTYDTFEEALAAMKERRAKDATAHDMLTNLDRADGGGGDDGQGWSNGITDDEQMALEESGLA